MRAAAPLLAVALATGCSAESSGGPESASSPEASASASPTPPPAPVVGECHRLTFAGAAQPAASTEAIPCQQPHTSETVKVGRLDALLGGQELDVESGEARDRVAQACSQRLLRYAGGDQQIRRLSRLEVVWFVPSKEASDAGASWFRCDVVGIAAANRLVRLPRTVKRALDAPDALDTLGTCGTTAPGKRGFDRVVCRRKHTWRAVDTVEIARTARYLGKGAAAQGDSECQDVAAARANGALKYTWSFEWPTRAQWEAGQRYGYCWVPA